MVDALVIQHFGHKRDATLVQEVVLLGLLAELWRARNAQRRTLRDESQLCPTFHFSIRSSGLVPANIW